MSSAEVMRLLDDLASRVATIVRGSPFHPEDATEVGAALVDAHFVGVNALGPSLRGFGADRASGARIKCGAARR